MSGPRCQAGRIGPTVNFLRTWKRGSLWDRCRATATRRVIAGCVHEHVLSWDACAGCAERVQEQLAAGKAPQCVECHHIDGHACPVLVQVEEAPMTGAA